jgi:hypothetical protein
LQSFYQLGSFAFLLPHISKGLNSIKQVRHCWRLPLQNISKTLQTWFCFINFIKPLLWTEIKFWELQMLNQIICHDLRGRRMNCEDWEEEREGNEWSYITTYLLYSWFLSIVPKLSTVFRCIICRMQLPLRVFLELEMVHCRQWMAQCTVLPHQNGKRRRILQPSKLLQNVNSTMVNSCDYTAVILMEE